MASKTFDSISWGNGMACCITAPSQSVPEPTLTCNSFGRENFHWSLQWRHNERDGVSNHRRLNCLLSCLFRYRSKKTSKLRVTGLCRGNPPVAGGFPSQPGPVTWKMFPFDDVIISCATNQSLKSVSAHRDLNKATAIEQTTFSN